VWATSSWCSRHPDTQSAFTSTGAEPCSKVKGQPNRCHSCRQEGEASLGGLGGGHNRSHGVCMRA
jgi:hypothetical protein